MDNEQKETLTEDDLDRVFIRGQKNGKWGSYSVREVDDAQFDEWAQSRMPIQGSGPWSLKERAEFCNQLYQAGRLHILKKGVTFEDDE